jgi:hypothetical protein
MTRINHVNELAIKLKELSDRAPKNWKAMVAKEMKISVSSVKKILDGTRHPNENSKRLQIAKHLTAIIEKEKMETIKMIETIENL